MTSLLVALASLKPDIPALLIFHGRGAFVSVPARGHALVVPTLSRDDRVAGPAVVAFVRGLACE